jgi:hypothetical protein
MSDSTPFRTHPHHVMGVSVSRERTLQSPMGFLRARTQAKGCQDSDTASGRGHGWHVDTVGIRDLAATRAVHVSNTANGQAMKNVRRESLPGFLTIKASLLSSDHLYVGPGQWPCCDLGQVTSQWVRLVGAGVGEQLRCNHYRRDQIDKRHANPHQGARTLLVLKR